MPIQRARRSENPEQISRHILDGQRVNNNLLLRMPEREFRRLAPHLKFCSLQLTEVLGHQGGPIKTVYFLNEGIASLIVKRWTVAAWR